MQLENSKPNSSNLLQIISKRKKLGLALGSILFVAFLLIGLFLVPQNYSSTISISFQSSALPASALTLLGGAGGSKKYVGVIKSRRLADEVDKIVGFRELLNFPNTEEGQELALEKVVKDLRVDDNVADGLLYITVSLPGPARFGSDPGQRRKRLPVAVSITANAYANALRRYLRDSDTDKEQSLLKSGAAQVKNAEAAYNNRLSVLGEFINQHRSSSAFLSKPNGAEAGIGATPSSVSGNGMSSEMGASQSELGSLYFRRNALQQQITSLDTLMAKTDNLLTDPNDNLTKLPTEDPLLLQSRKQVTDAMQNLQSLRITYGESKPAVKQAKAQLGIAEKRLHDQVNAILAGKTSDHLKKLAIQSEYDTVLQQIGISEKNFYQSRKAMFQMGRLQNSVMISLDVLKAKMAKYAELQIQTVSAQSRMAIVDGATPPLHPSPGIAIILVMSALASIGVLGIWLLIEFQLSMTSRKDLPGGA